MSTDKTLPDCLREFALRKWPHKEDHENSACWQAAAKLEELTAANKLQRYELDAAASMHEYLCAARAERDALRAELSAMTTAALVSQVEYEKLLSTLRAELNAAYTEMRKQWPSLRVVFDRDVWARAAKGKS